MGAFARVPGGVLLLEQAVWGNASFVLNYDHLSLQVLVQDEPPQPLQQLSPCP